MATKEAKPEAKKTEHKKAPGAIPHKLPNLPTLHSKTCSFRVSIHCEGCKRKVKKILTNIEGVDEVDVDLKQQKVTVVGIISPEILIKKLIKAGKNAEILPENPEPKVNKPGNCPNPNPNPSSKNKDEKKDDANSTKRNDDGATTSGDLTNAAGEKSVTAKKGGSGDEKCDSSGDWNNTGCSAREKSVTTMNGPSGTGEKGVSGGCDGAEDRKTSRCGKIGEAGGPVKGKKAEIKKVASKSPAAEDKTVEASCSGSVGKKKKKKGQKRNNNANTVNGQCTTDAPADTEPSPAVPPLVPQQQRANHDRPSHQHIEIANHIPPRHQEHPYPSNICIPTPIYGVSYNMAQPPASVYGASYFTAPYSQTYMHPGFPPSDEDPYASSRPSDSFEYFSDENPNACSVM